MKKTNLFNGNINIDQDLDGKVTVRGEANLTQDGKDFLSKLFSNILSAASKELAVEDKTTEEVEDEEDED